MADHLLFHQSVVSQASPANEPGGRVEVLAKEVSEKAIPVRITALGDAPLKADVWLRNFDRMHIGKYDTSALVMARDESLAQPDDRGVTLTIAKMGRIIGQQSGQSHMVEFGQGLVLSMASPSDVVLPEGGQWWGIRTQFDELMARANCKGALGKSIIATDSAVLNLMWNYLEYARAQCTNTQDHSLAFTQNHILDLFALLVEQSAQDPTLSQELPAVIEARFLQIRNVMAATLHQTELTLIDTARRCRISERTVQQVLRSAGTSFSEMLFTMRMDRARKLLHEQPKSKILSVAMDVGFTDQSAFSRAFRRRFGISPGDVRGITMPKPQNNAD